MARKKTDSSWEIDPNAMGYGKHPYRSIDPTTINPEDYARDFRGDQQHMGDVREYNCSRNEKHPENKVSFDWLCRVGTTFETDAPGWLGKWRVAEVPTTKGRRIFVRCERLDAAGEVGVIPADELGIVEDADHMFKQVKCLMIDRGKVARETRKEVTI